MPESALTEYRRILLDGTPVEVVRTGDVLRAHDGREIGVDEATHLPPVQPLQPAHQAGSGHWPSFALL